jgi:hypothetical protein
VVRRGNGRSKHLKEDKVQGSNDRAVDAAPFSRLGGAASVGRNGWPAGPKPRSRSETRPEPVVEGTRIRRVRDNDGEHRYPSREARGSTARGGATSEEVNTRLGVPRRLLASGLRPDQSCEGYAGAKARVEPHERCRDSNTRSGQAATMPGGGSVTEHVDQYPIQKNPCTNDPRGDAQDVSVKTGEAGPGWEARARRR